jgi:molecular chaperone HscA
MQLRALKEQQVEAERIVLATRSALGTDAALLSDEEHASILKLMQSVEDYAAGNDRNAIEAAIDALSIGTEDFAARRMDQSVRAALTGKKLDQI